MRGPDTGWMVILLLVVFGAVASVVAINQGWISAETVGKYGIWTLLGLIALYLFAGHFTRSKWDDIIISYLLLLSIGGFTGTWLVDHGYTTYGYILMIGMGVLFLLLLGLYSKTGYAKVGKRFS